MRKLIIFLEHLGSKIRTIHIFPLIVAGLSVINGVFNLGQGNVVTGFIWFCVAIIQFLLFLRL